MHLVSLISYLFYCCEAQLWPGLLGPNFVPRLKRQKIQFGPKLTFRFQRRWNSKLLRSKPFQGVFFLNNIPTLIFLNDIPTLLQSLYFSRNDKSPIAEKVMGSLFDIWFFACLRISKESLQEWNLKYLVDFQYVNISNMSIYPGSSFMESSMLSIDCPCKRKGNRLNIDLLYKISNLSIVNHLHRIASFLI